MNNGGMRMSYQLDSIINLKAATFCSSTEQDFPAIDFFPFWNQDNKCIVLNWPMTTTMVVFRSMSDLIYLIHMLLQVTIQVA